MSEGRCQGQGGKEESQEPYEVAGHGAAPAAGALPGNP
jgi:hypothetical protein